ncbi:MAG: hypothetical protein AAFQ98_06980 [Bacteroidota bacterium]
MNSTFKQGLILLALSLVITLHLVAQPSTDDPASFLPLPSGIAYFQEIEAIQKEIGSNLGDRKTSDRFKAWRMDVDGEGRAFRGFLSSNGQAFVVLQPTAKAPLRKQYFYKDGQLIFVQEREPLGEGSDQWVTTEFYFVEGELVQLAQSHACAKPYPPSLLKREEGRLLGEATLLAERLN